MQCEGGQKNGEQKRADDDEVACLDRRGEQKHRAQEVEICFGRLSSWKFKDASRNIGQYCTYIYLIFLLCSPTFSPPGPWGKYFAFQRCLVRMATGQYAVADQMQRNSPSRSGSNSCKASSSPQMSRVGPWGMGIARNLQGSPPNSLFDEPTTRYWPSLSNDLNMNIVGMSST